MTRPYRRTTTISGVTHTVSPTSFSTSTNKGHNNGLKPIVGERGEQVSNLIQPPLSHESIFVSIYFQGRILSAVANGLRSDNGEQFPDV